MTKMRKFIPVKKHKPKPKLTTKPKKYVGIMLKITTQESIFVLLIKDFCDTAYQFISITRVK